MQGKQYRLDDQIVTRNGYFFIPGQKKHRGGSTICTISRTSIMDLMHRFWIDYRAIPSLRMLISLLFPCACPGPGTRLHSSKIRAVQVLQMGLSRILNIWEMAWYSVVNSRFSPILFKNPPWARNWITPWLSRQTADVREVLRAAAPHGRHRPGPD